METFSLYNETFISLFSICFRWILFEVMIILTHLVKDHENIVDTVKCDTTWDLWTSEMSISEPVNGLFKPIYKYSTLISWMFNEPLDSYPTKANDLQSMTSKCRLNHLYGKKWKNLVTSCMTMMKYCDMLMSSCSNISTNCTFVSLTFINLFPLSALDENKKF